MQSPVEHYRDVGYTPPVDVLSRSASLAMRRLFFEAIGQSEERTHHISREIPNWHARYAWCEEIARNPRIADLVQDMLQSPNIMIWSMLFWYKQAGDVTYVPWHQDGAYWPMTPIKTITAWIALGDVDDRNGALHFLPGRRTELRPHQGLDDPESEFITRFPDSVDSRHEVRVDMESGQACLFDAFTVHRTGPNRSAKARIGCGMRFATPDVAFDTPQWQRYQPAIFMLRGQDRYDLNPAFTRTWPDSTASIT